MLLHAAAMDRSDNDSVGDDDWQRLCGSAVSIGTERFSSRSALYLVCSRAMCSKCGVWSLRGFEVPTTVAELRHRIIHWMPKGVIDKVAKS